MSEARILDGKKVAQEIRDEVARGAADLVAKGHRPPGLAVVLVGDNPASLSYVRSKTKACEEAGFHSVQVDLPATISQSDLEKEIARLNADPAIHGILVQLPLPGKLEEKNVILAISPEKDVDGLHPVNAGKLSLGDAGFVPCTPLGVKELMMRTGIETSGKLVAVIGRSNLVGKPLALLLSAKAKGANATVILCHSGTKDLASLTRQADIVVAAIGVPHFLKPEMIKPGATVIDVGINRVEDSTRERGYRIVGDVDYDAVKPIAGAITPVPGGVGPLTIAMLLSNALRSARLAAGVSTDG